LRLGLGVRVGVGFGLVTLPFNTPSIFWKVTSRQFHRWRLVLTGSYLQDGLQFPPSWLRRRSPSYRSSFCRVHWPRVSLRAGFQGEMRACTDDIQFWISAP
jgi:hypothetical protein